MLLKGFGFSGYRSFGDELAKIAPLKKVNLIIGQNNSGKSNIINFLKYHYEYFYLSAKQGGRVSKCDLKDIDLHRSANKPPHRIAFPLLQEELNEHIISKMSNYNANRNNRILVEAAEKILCSNELMDKNGTIWFVYKSEDHRGVYYLEISIPNLYPMLEPIVWQNLWNALTNKTGGNWKNNWVPETISALSCVPASVPNVEIIPAIRKIGVAGSTANDFSGEGIIERLAQIQNPSLSEQEQKEKFNKINTFVREVLETPSATIEIPYGRDMILVHMDGKTLPLESLGTGVHEVIIIAAASTLLEETIICVEEPELHLHPILQRKLIQYLSDKTDNQYFFTTHSAHLLDATDAEIFHVTHTNNQSHVDAISSTKEKSDICRDLGYKASDLLQSNCIIWVEGPSDRIYLNYWISAKAPNLIEGVHYSIMFYGGRLFSHLTALDDDEIQEKIDDFISVRNLNRNSVIMFDSDKDKARARLSKTKKRLQQEFDSGFGFAWVTKGREVENYLNEDQLQESIIAVHPSAKCIENKGPWSNLLKYEKKKGKTVTTANKVKVARHYIENNKPDFDVLDLNKKVEELCDFIRRSN